MLGGELAPGDHAGGGIAPIARTGQIQRRTVAVPTDQGHHIGHRPPLVDADQGRAMSVFDMHHAARGAHAQAPVGRGDDDSRAGDVDTAGRGEHLVRGGEEEEGVDVLLVERIAHRAELARREVGLGQERDGHEQAVCTGHALDGGDGRDGAEEPQSPGDQTDGVGPARSERPRGVARVVIERPDSLTHALTSRGRHVGRIVDDAGDRLVAHPGHLRDLEHRRPPAGLSVLCHIALPCVGGVRPTHDRLRL